MDHTLVLGIGNTLLSDEGAGVHTLRYLRARPADLPGVRYLDGGTLSFTLSVDIAAADHMLVIDAAQLKQAPGSVRCFENEDMDRFLGTRGRSVHEVGLMDLLDIARLEDHLPYPRALVGIQPHTLDWGEAPSEVVAQAIPKAAAQVLALLRRWHPLTMPKPTTD